MRFGRVVARLLRERPADADDGANARIVRPDDQRVNKDAAVRGELLSSSRCRTMCCRTRRRTETLRRARSGWRPERRMRAPPVVVTIPFPCARWPGASTGDCAARSARGSSTRCHGNGSRRSSRTQVWRTCNPDLTIDAAVPRRRKPIRRRSIRSRRPILSIHAAAQVPAARTSMRSPSHRSSPVPARWSRRSSR